MCVCAVCVYVVVVVVVVCVWAFIPYTSPTVRMLKQRLLRSGEVCWKRTNPLC